MQTLSIEHSAPLLLRDRRITLGARAARLKVDYVVLADVLAISQIFGAPPDATLDSPGGTLYRKSQDYFEHCAKFIQDCNDENLPKIAVESTLQFAETARSFQSCMHSLKLDIKDAAATVTQARELLEQAKQLCLRKFQNAEELRKAVEETLRLLEKEWYEEVTPEDIASIKVRPNTASILHINGDKRILKILLF